MAMRHLTARQAGARGKGRQPGLPRARRRQAAFPPSSPPREQIQKRHHLKWWTEAENRLVAKAMKSWSSKSDRELARRLGRSVKALQNHRRYKFGLVKPPPPPWKRSEERYLGLRTDPEVARLTGRHPQTVGERRRRLGIPPFRRRRPWTRAEDRLLGKMSDPAVGKKIGRLAVTVGARRRKLGIARHEQPRGLHTSRRPLARHHVGH